MENKDRLTWKIRLAAFSVFLLGFVAGGLAFNIYNTWFARDKRITKDEKYERIFDQLNLSEDQKIEVRRIIAETREEVQALRKDTEPRMKEIRTRASEKFQRVLTPEQWEKFQRLREEAFSEKRSD
jgi:Spy/CpxP family protein refolding chaperone